MPSYLLRTPNSHEIPFPDLLRSYNGFEPGQNWIDLRPLMELGIENAYYQPGASRQGLEGFLGTEIAQYEVTARGLHLLSFHPMKDRPSGDLPVQQLISRPQMRHRYYRFYYEIFFKNRRHSHGSVLLGADSIADLDRLSAGLNAGSALCTLDSEQCTVFPEACSISIEMKIVLNGQPRAVIWGTTLAGAIASQPRNIKLERVDAGRLTPVQIDAGDPRALQLPLLPGDHVSWN